MQNRPEVAPTRPAFDDSRQRESGKWRRTCQEDAAGKGLRFESLEQAQTYLDHWEARWADTRIQSDSVNP